LLARVRRTIEAHRLVEPGDRVVAAVSGGPDSVCLLHVLRALARRSHLALHVAHLDHGWRGEAGRRDAEFVRALAARWGLPATIEALPADRLARRGRSREEVAREARRAFLEAVADRVGARRIALGHTADDQAETVLLQLLRGAGARGLGGMRPADGRIIRPLLEVGRDAVAGYVARHRLATREDATNRDRRFLRNRIRHDLLPLLARRFNPRIREALTRTAALLRDEAAFLDEAGQRAAAGLVADEPDGAALPAAGLAGLAPALRRRVIREAVRRVRGDLRGLGHAHVEAIARLAAVPGAREARLPGGLVARRDGGIVRLTRGGRAGAVGPADYALAAEGETAAPAFGLRFVARTVGPGPPAGQARPARGPWVAHLDADRLAHPLRVRAWRHGDGMWPVGLGGRKKLQDLFVDAKVPRSARARTALVESGGAIAWVVGLRLDARFAAGPASRRVLILEAHPA
jgi:tRNA(Ile)-lysidine synthase